MGHPTGVQPVGLACIGGSGGARASVRDVGLGDLRALDDELVCRVLEQCGALDLVRFSVTSRAAYCFANHEDLWRALVLQELGGRFEFQASWKHTYVYMRGDAARPAKRTRGLGTAVRQEARLQIKGMYSDHLYHGHLVATHPIEEVWLEGDCLVRRHELSAEEFAAVDAAGAPVVMPAGAAFERAVRRWTWPHLEAQLRGATIKAGDMDMRAEDYFAYMRRQNDDAPLYLFDPRLASARPALAADYDVPRAFGEDLLGLLGEGRPGYRWLIAGPARSGSTFHVDPNGTSAWNAVVRGAKLWVLAPPGAPPPGVHASADGASVVTPVSVVEWFLHFFSPAAAAAGRAAGWHHGVVRAGEVLFVPAGWWHCALNLEATIAVTHNFVSAANLPRVLRCLRTRDPDLISGCPREERSALYGRFCAALEAHRPELLAAWRREEEDEAAERSAASALAKRFQSDGAGRGAARSLCGTAPAACGFSFGFAL